MDPTILATLDDAGIDKTFRSTVPTIGIQVDAAGQVRPAGERLLVVAGDKTVPIALKKISELFRGARTPPSFRSGPTEEYTLFFAMLEMTVIDYCHCSVRPEYDAELERLYTYLRRRPDGRDANPLFSYMQAAARLYMSAFDVSQAEFDAVCRRLSQSAGRFGDGPTSTNYFTIVGGTFAQAGR